MFSVEEIIEKYVGGFGPAQLFQVAIVALGVAFDAQNTFVTIFTDDQPSWRCINGSQITETEICTTQSSICEMDTTLWEWERGKEVSVISQWNLVCANTIQAGFPSLFFFMGSLLGCIIVGPLADSWLGRKRTLMLSIVSLSLMGFLTACSPNIWIYSLLRALSGFSRASIGTYCLVLSSELAGRQWRSLISFFVFLFFTLGFLSLPALAYLTRNTFSWRITYIYISILPLAYSLLLLPFIWESPRWLLLRGNSKEALKCLRKMAEMNGRVVPENVAIEDCIAESQTESSLSLLWTTKWARRRLMSTMAVGSGMGLIYYGMPFGVVSLDFNSYLSVTFNALSDIPAAIFSTIILAKAERRRAILLLSLLSGMLCFLCVFYSMGIPDIPNSKNWAHIVSEVGAFLSANTACNVLLIYCLESFPSSVRNSALSMLREAIYVGAIVSPVIVVIGHSNTALSFGLFGIGILISGLFVLGLPETKDQPLYDTLEKQDCQETLLSKTELGSPLLT
ncbi:organic cation/carnitine transporter 1 [Cryptomeria japonica]|uniref:organic cation/carnitine transporter 1 n=1 Tax=Cryptomeria japonica TaxID=3369 RepID=UPI0027D9E5F7|nr:organic cation/carnitine transporter 1 [Cryptomeria japonica]